MLTSSGFILNAFAVVVNGMCVYMGVGTVGLHLMCALLSSFALGWYLGKEGN